MLQEDILSLFFAISPAYVALIVTVWVEEVIDHRRYSRSQRAFYIQANSYKRSDDKKFTKRLLNKRKVIYFGVSSGVLTIPLLCLLNNGFKKILINPIFTFSCSGSPAFLPNEILISLLILVIAFLSLILLYFSYRAFSLKSFDPIQGLWWREFKCFITFSSLTFVSMALFNFAVLYLSGNAS